MNLSNYREKASRGLVYVLFFRSGDLVATFKLK